MRNRLKRLIREGYYKYMNDIKQGFDIVVLWNKKCDVSKADVNIITNDFNTIFNKFELFNQDMIYEKNFIEDDRVLSKKNIPKNKKEV